jgi:predicted nucleic acid-binding protein
MKVRGPSYQLSPPYKGMRIAEREVISLAKELGDAFILMDEGPGRSRAEIEGLEWVGTLDILLQAKRRGMIPSVEADLKALKSAGFHMTPNVYEDVLRKAEEDEH